MSQITDRLFHLTEPAYFDRGFVRDFGFVFEDESWIGLSKIVTCAALYLLALYRPLAPFLATTGSAIRLYTDWTAYREFKPPTDPNDKNLPLVSPSISLAMSIAGFAAIGFIGYPLSTAITTGQDMLEDAIAINSYMLKGSYADALERSVYLVNESFYLAVLMGGGFSVTIAYFASQVLICTYNGYTDITDRSYLAATVSALLVLGRGYQAHNYYQLNQKTDFLPENRLSHATPIKMQTGNSLTGRVTLAPKREERETF